MRDTTIMILALGVISGLLYGQGKTLNKINENLDIIVYRMQK